jgi:hypothetical protein
LPRIDQATVQQHQRVAGAPLLGPGIHVTQLYVPTHHPSFLRRQRGRDAITGASEREKMLSLLNIAAALIISSRERALRCWVRGHAFSRTRWAPADLR